MKVNQTEMKRASTWYIIGSFFNKGIAFFTVPIFTRLLSTTDYGIVTTYDSWVAITAMVVGFALHTGIRIAFVDYKEEIEDFMATVTSFTVMSGAVVSVIIVFILHFVSVNINVYLIVLCLLQSISSALIEDYSMYLMMQYRYKFRTIWMIVPNLISVFLSIIMIKYIMNDNLYLGRIIPTALTLIIFGGLTCILVFRKCSCILKIEYLRYALTFSAPLILHGIALNILSQSDRTMITWLANSSQTGIYSLIYNFSMIATVITTSLEGVWVPWFYKNVQEKNYSKINKIAKDYINLMTYCLIVIIMIGPEVVKFLSSDDYWTGIKIIPPVVISNFVIFSYTLYVNIEHYHKKTKGITFNTIIAAVVNIILNYILIPKFGYIAAAFTTLISYLISFELHAYKAKKLESKLYPIKYFIPSFGAILAFSIIFYIFIDHTSVRWGVTIIFVGIMIFKEWKRIVTYFPILNKKDK